MKTRKVKDLLVEPAESIESAMSILDETGQGIVLVTNEEKELLGTVTDGDIRRGLLSGKNLGDEISSVMNEDPIVANKNMSEEAIVELMRANTVQQIPLLDERKRVDGIVLLRDLVEEETHRLKNPAVVLAGGLGTRLRPMTHETPKPLLEVGDKPILEIIVERLVSSGFENIYLSICYEAEQIKEYFGDGQNHGVNISYIEEDDLTGTAGPLRLLAGEVERPFLVMNGDLLTKVDFNSLLNFHKESGYELTIGSTKYEFEIPYGVIRFKDEIGEIRGITEKPTEDFFVNGGIYALEPEVINHIPEGQEYDMTDLIGKLLDKDKKVGSFPIHEYWLDIGEKDDYQKANGEYSEYFGEVENEA